MIHKLRRRADLLPSSVTLFGVMVVAAIATPEFYSRTNLQNVSFQLSFLLVVALGQLLVIIVGGIDLSVGAVMSAALIVVVHVAGQDGDSVPVGLLAVLAAGLAVGLANAALITIRRVPAILATLASLVLLNGTVLWITEGRSRGRVPEAIVPFGSDRVFGIPVPLVLALVTALIVWIALDSTSYGRSLVATGSNPEAARLSGVPVRRVAAATYVACSVLAVIAGLLLAGFVGFPDRTIGNGFDLSSITAVVLGGAVLGGGKGSVAGTVIAVAALACLENVLLLLGIDVSVQFMIKALVLLAAVSAPHLAAGRGGPGAASRPFRANRPLSRTT